ncbi:PA14 domain-containing protein [Streptomyces sp. ISL-100]|uniref:PA14 domain-containing protein n=1 Tax=Streptomyces sp. ISL-100 TaxID=2819173 RepID=UPI001BEB9F75|nr:PA14 domain-containing protein [Streptomyces sp. ISL-100]MBT2396029.1 hypothetical protein [Streptomyces sp. ISL-100]
MRPPPCSARPSQGVVLPTSAAQAAVTCTDGVWKATYYANTSFSGTPKLTACDTSVNEDYGTGDPAGVTLPRDNFTVRWATTRDFGSGGPFAFTTEVRDGIRVYVDGVRKVDVWKNVSTTQKKTVNLTVPKGRHTIRVDFVAWTGYANVKFAYTPRTSADVDKVAPLAPTAARATYSSSTLTTTVAWSKSPEMDLAGYRVYRRLKGSTAYTRLNTTPVTATTYTNTPPATGAVYYYEVRAIDKAGNESTGTTDMPVITADRTAPAAPTGIRFEDSYDGVAISWDAVPGAVSYKVGQMDASVGDFYLHPVGETSTNRITDTTAPRQGSRLYRVDAYDAAGNVGSSQLVEFYRPVAAPPVTLAPQSDRVVLTWENNPDKYGAAYDYVVHRSTTLPVDTTGTPVDCDESLVTVDGVKKWRCTNTGLASETTYHYALVATDNRASSTPAGPFTTTTQPKDITPPDAPANLTAEPTEYGIKIDWDDSQAEDFRQYVVRSCDESGNNCDSPPAITSRTRSEYLFVNAADGEKRTYSITTSDYRRNTSPATSVTATELDLSPTVATPPGSPLRVNYWTLENGIGVYWTCSTGPCEGISGYSVHRWDRASETFVSLTDGRLARDVSSWDDRTAPAGTTHFYRVTVHYADGTDGIPFLLKAPLAP